MSHSPGEISRSLVESVRNCGVRYQTSKDIVGMSQLKIISDTLKSYICHFLAGLNQNSKFVGSKGHHSEVEQSRSRDRSTKVENHTISPIPMTLILF